MSITHNIVYMIYRGYYSILLKSPVYNSLDIIHIMIHEMIIKF